MTLRAQIFLFVVLVAAISRVISQNWPANAEAMWCQDADSSRVASFKACMSQGMTSGLLATSPNSNFVLMFGGGRCFEDGDTIPAEFRGSLRPRRDVLYHAIVDGTVRTFSLDTDQRLKESQSGRIFSLC